MMVTFALVVVVVIVIVIVIIVSTQGNLSLKSVLIVGKCNHETTNQKTCRDLRLIRCKSQQEKN